ncbi:MAG: restriction endonuclease subunit M [endosymbiont of Seepiophila jonesi]|uniref:site-specific DNA-methyltransferase (adenine-specific) n=1 Tax=endosymbiont of Lamellibrachia luymesi TaxID=2200907 RepID=A0A370E0P2_9GAMM|nr:MAG: restriction endonuclease subunit M [endosymbiont of Lamellibrachia luymesi]RDH92298.1 MAG: restriction endonuclease subunit M [endosymbiont of Seepiophila jonesi]
MNPIIPWIGGKRRLATTLLPMFPEHTCYVEAFAGAAALFFQKEASDVEVLNDINGDLVNLYRVVKHHLEELYKQFKWVLTSRQNWDWLQSTPTEILTDIQRAARFLYLQKMAFGGKVDGQCFGTATTSRPRFNIFTLEQDLADAHFRLSNTYIEHLTWQKVIDKYDRPHTLHYLDPPYWQTEGYGVEFGFEHYEVMATLAREVEGALIISINDHPDIRRVFDGLHMKTVDINYTVGGGGGSKARELIIWNDNCQNGRRPGEALSLF